MRLTEISSAEMCIIHLPKEVQLHMYNHCK